MASSERQEGQRRSAGKRQAALSMRIAPETRDLLIERAQANGRTVTQEADRLLLQAMHTGSLLDQVFDLAYGDPQLVALLLTIGEAMRDTLTLIKANADWIDDPNSFGEVACAAQQTIEAYRPIGDPAPNTGEAAVAMVRLILHKISEGAAGMIYTTIRSRLGDTLARLRARQRSDDGRITPTREEINQ